MLKCGARRRGLLSKQSMHSCTNTNTAPEYTGTFSSSAEYLSSWLATMGGKEKKGNSVWQAAESDAALLHKAAHMVIKPASGPLRRENKRMTKCSPCPLSFSWSLLPRLLRHSYASCREDKKKKKKKNKMEKDIKDISDDRWGGITKEKTSRDGSSSTKQNAKMQQKKKRCQSFASGFCQRGEHQTCRGAVGNLITAAITLLSPQMRSQM